MTEDLHVLLVDGHPLYMPALRMMLESLGPVSRVTAATGLEETLPRLASAKPDVVLLQLEACGEDVGLAIRRIRGVSEVPVLLFCEPPLDDRLVLAVEAGACGSIVGTGDSTVLLDGLRRAAAGDYVIDEGLLPDLVGRLREKHRESFHCPPGTDDHGFSARELQILQLVANGAANAAIAEQLSISASTVKNHLNRIFAKLGAANRCEAVMEAMRRNLICCSRCPLKGEH